MSEVERLIWSSVVPGLVLNEDAAIYKLWSSYRVEGNYLGVPVTAEIAVGEVGNDEVQQGFSSGAIIAWDPINGARLV